MIDFKRHLESLIMPLIAELFGDHGISIDLQETRKEFKADLTLVVFPFLKYSNASPEETAEIIGSKLSKQLSEIDNFNVVKGFLNLNLSQEFISKIFVSIRSENNFGVVATSSSEPSVMVEYSSPNTNKPLHLGHIRNNLIGHSISNILKASGRNVVQVQIINDRGVHICKSMWAWKRFGNNETPENSGLKGDHLVGKYYVLFDQEYKRQVSQKISNGISEVEAKKSVTCILEVQNMLLDWEAGDSEVVALWNKMNGWVYSGFNKTYQRLGIEFDKNYYESETYLLGKSDIALGLKRNIFYRKEDNSVWIDLTNDGLDEKIVLRSDGSSVYMTQDIGTAIQRFKDFEINSLTYVVGNEQDYHFKVLFLILEKLGYKWAKRLHHLSYGMVDLPTGKMKSREGRVVDADDLLDEMESTAKQMSTELGKAISMSSNESQMLDKIIGHGALKYFILKVDPKKRMVFNPDDSVDFNGNTGPFLQYTHARISSLIKKAGHQQSFDLSGVQWNEKERDLVRGLSKFPEVIHNSAIDLNPSHIANYLYEIAKNFNSFYQKHSVLSAENTTIAAYRLNLCTEVAGVLRRGLNLLGIDAPEKM
tara:strand:- start:2032 stop:3810 length:1779 start_codon:yes stop_codon:yes gene_type:complete